MRKQTKLVAVLSAAALLAIGGSMTAFAAGWTEEDGTWVYLDSDNERVYQEWRRSGNNWFWLDENGEMATDTIVEDEDDRIYYVDENGARVSNRWVSVDNEDGDEVGGYDVSTLWYYFGSNGRATRASDSDNDTKVFAIGDRRYIFDENGHMLSGWQNLAEGESTDGLYYLGDENEGWAYTGWQFLDVDDDIHNTSADASDYDTEWFLFRNTGKARVNTTYYANGAYYTFNEDGVMLDNWYGVSTPPTASGGNAYVSETGSIGNGWVYTTPPNDDGGDASWYYLITLREGDSVVRGFPFNYGTNGYAARYIRNKTYVFDNEGKMKTGIIDFTDSDNSFVTTGAHSGTRTLTPGIYYFNEASGSTQGQMATGKTTVEDDGDTYYYYFRSNGMAYTNALVDGCIYGADGKRLNAEDGSTNEVKNISGIGFASDSPLFGVNQVIVNRSGRVRRSGTVRIDGIRWIVDDYAARIDPDQD